MKSKKKKLLKIYSSISVFLIFFVILLIAVLKNFFIYSDIKEKYNSINNSLKKEKNKMKKNIKYKEEIKNKMKIEHDILNQNMIKRKGEKVIKLIE